MRHVKSEPRRLQARAKERKPKNFGFAIHPELLDAILMDARKFNCSASFVINTAISITMGIGVGEKYWLPKDVKERKPARLVNFRQKRAAS